MHNTYAKFVNFDPNGSNLESQLRGCHGSCWPIGRNTTLYLLYLLWNIPKILSPTQAWVTPWDATKSTTSLGILRCEGETYLRVTLYIVNNLARLCTVRPCFRSPTMVMLRPLTVPVSRVAKKDLRRLRGIAAWYWFHDCSYFWGKWHPNFHAVV